MESFIHLNPLITVNRIPRLLPVDTIYNERAFPRKIYEYILYLYWNNSVMIDLFTPHGRNTVRAHLQMKLLSIARYGYYAGLQSGDSLI